MTTPFLYRFSVAVLTRLLEGRRVELQPGGEEQAVLYVSNKLAQAGEGSSLISTLSAALMSCPEVLELFADEEELKELVSDLGV